MSERVFDKTLEWVTQISSTAEEVEITFHGGEPLLVGHSWFKRALPLLKKHFGSRLKLSVQSNLWLLDEEYCALFSEYNVSIGTSLDGPPELNDRWRGCGYYERTMSGVNLAREAGLSVGTVCTFTKDALLYYEDILNHFVELGLPISFHAAVSSLLKEKDNELFLNSTEYAELLVKLLAYYVDHIDVLHNATLDAILRGLSAQSGGVCMFGDCLGRYLAVDSDGFVYPCNRFVGHAEWRMSSVASLPSYRELACSSVWKRLEDWFLMVKEECGDCIHFSYCKGGCPYNSFVIGGKGRDPHCEAYKVFFDEIVERALSEVFSDENIDQVIKHGTKENGMLQNGKFLQIMRGEGRSGYHL